jgi:hypothetical protein
MNPFKIHRCGFRPLREVYEWMYSRVPSGAIRLSDALPGRISEGEATLHPDFFEICALLRSKYNNPLHITTNGSLLTNDFVRKMAEYNPFKVLFSYHSRNKENWTKVFGLSDKQHNIATTAFQRLVDHGIEVQGAIVPLPNMFGYDDVEETLYFLNQYCSSTKLWKPGYSDYASEELQDLLTVDDKEFREFVTKVYKTCTNMVIEWDTDPTAPLQVVPYRWMQESVEAGYQNVMWLTARSNADRLWKIINHYTSALPNIHHIGGIKNNTYGGNISCNGLLMMQDIQQAVREVDSHKGIANIDLFVLPWWR